MRLDVLTLFPGMFGPVLNDSIIKRAQEKHLVCIKVFDLRHWTHDRRRTVDDKPYGGGPGMVLKPEPVFEACDALRQADTHVVLLSPQGRPFVQQTACRLAQQAHVLLICGHYEGFDERIRSLASEELSLGDFVLTGGEIPALAVIDAVVRLIPGVLGEKESLRDESFSAGLLEYPHYTRPPVYREMAVPDILLSGDHAEIARWRRLQSLQRTRERRSDLWQAATVPLREQLPCPESGGKRMSKGKTRRRHEGAAG